MLATVLARRTKKNGMNSLFGILILENDISPSKKLLLMGFTSCTLCSFCGVRPINRTRRRLYSKLELVIMLRRTTFADGATTTAEAYATFNA